jgi:Na+/proline symporter
MHAATFTILGYLSLVTILVVILSRRTKSASDWATASGGLGIVIIAAGIAGTRIGGAGTYGVAAEVMRSGIWNVWYGINTFLALALVALFFAKPYRRLGLTTIGELFELRYGRSRSGWMTSLCVQTEYFVVNVIEPLLIGIIISNITGIELITGIFIGSAVIIAATALSGLRGTSFSNIIHCLVIIFGLGLVAYIGAGKLGGWDGVVSQANRALEAENLDSGKWWSLVGMGWLPIIAMFFSATIHTPAASIYVNYSKSAKDENILIPAFLIAGMLAALMPLLSAIIGIEALAKYGADSGIGSYSSITRIAMDAGPFIGGVAVAAVLAALISSGGPILLASSTMVVNDWIPASKKYSLSKKLWVYRITSVIYGLLAASIACYFGYVVGTASVLQWLLLGYAMVVPPAIAIGYIFYVQHTAEEAVYWGIASGYFLGLGAWVLDKLVFHHEQDITAYITTLVPLVVIPNLSLIMQGDLKANPGVIGIRVSLGPILALALVSSFYFIQMDGEWNTITKTYCLMAPLVIACLYWIFIVETSSKGLTWGLAGSYAISLGAWWLNENYGFPGSSVLMYISVGVPIVIIPTMSLLTQGRIELSETASSFYKILKTPA